MPRISPWLSEGIEPTTTCVNMCSTILSYEVTPASLPQNVGEPAGKCALLVRLKAGCFAVSASGSDMERKWWPRTELHRHLPIQSRMLLLIELRGDWGDQPDLHRHGRLHRAGCYFYNMVNIGEMVLPRGLAPRTYAFARRCADSYTSGAWKIGAPCRCCPGFCGMKNRCAS